METIDLQPFVDWLKKRELAQDHCLPFYASWVDRFLKSPAGSLQGSDADRILSFADLIARNQQLKPWQRQQASQAVKLFGCVLLLSWQGLYESMLRMVGIMWWLVGSSGV